MATNLGESPLRMQAVVASYALAVAMVIPASGWLADKFGTRGVFLAAVVLFSLGSLACAMSGELTQLVAARVLQGIGGAMPSRPRPARRQHRAQADEASSRTGSTPLAPTVRCFRSTSSECTPSAWAYWATCSRVSAAAVCRT
jgi:MFS family permease